MKAVLWDLDGTIVDTEPYWIAREYELVAQYGNGAWNDEHARTLVGSDLLDAAAYLAEHGGIDLPPPQIVDLLIDGVIARMTSEVPWRPGARELLIDLAATGVPCALVTMSWRRVTDALLPLFPPDVFACVVTGDDVSRGKPHPDPYLLAAEQLGVEPADCLAVEDSPTGARAAVAAGCITVAVPHAVPVPPGIGHHRLPSLAGLSVDDLRSLYRCG